jgi:hypothetical protein
MESRWIPLLSPGDRAAAEGHHSSSMVGYHIFK